MVQSHSRRHSQPTFDERATTLKEVKAHLKTAQIFVTHCTHRANHRRCSDSHLGRRLAFHRWKLSQALWNDDTFSYIQYVHARADCTYKGGTRRIEKPSSRIARRSHRCDDEKLTPRDLSTDSIVLNMICKVCIKCNSHRSSRPLYKNTVMCVDISHRSPVILIYLRASTNLYEVFDNRRT